jgi:hypothetical protein
MGYAHFPPRNESEHKNLMRTCAQPAMQRRASTKTPKIRNQIKQDKDKTPAATKPSYRLQSIQNRKSGARSSRKYSPEWRAITQILDQILHTA